MSYRDAPGALPKVRDDAARVQAGAEPASAPARALHPVLAIQRSHGNLALQRLLNTPQDVLDGESEQAGGLARRIDGRRGLGDSLSPATRAFLEPRLGADLGAVRIHTGPAAHELTQAVSATAFATGNELYFRDGAYDPHSHGGMRLLTHEVAHVMQQTAGAVAGTPVEEGVSISDPSDEFEREADRAADAVMAMPTGDLLPEAPLAPIDAGHGGVAVQCKEDDDGWLGSLGSVIESAGSAVASGAGSILDAGGSALSDVASAATSGAGALWDAGAGAASTMVSGAGALWDAGTGLASDAGSAVGDAAGRVWSGARNAAGEVADFGADVYGQMKKDGKYVKQGVRSAEGGIDWLEQEAKDGTHWLANQAEGIPVLGQLAGGAESLVDLQVDVAGGGLKGLTGMAGGLLGMAADPVDAAAGLYSMAERLPITGLPLKQLHGAYDMAFSDKSAAAIANETFNPAADADYWGTFGKGLWAPLKASIDAGKPGEALGNAGIQIAAMFTGAGEAGAAAEGAEAASLAAEAGEVGTAADLAKLGEGADAAEMAEAAGAVKGPVRPGVDASLPAAEMPSGDFPSGHFDIPQARQAPELPNFREAPAGGLQELPPAQANAAEMSGEGASLAEAEEEVTSKTSAGMDAEAESARLQRGRNPRNRAISKYREMKLRALREEMESGIHSPETELLGEDRGYNVASELADGEMTLGEAKVNVHHKTSVAEDPTQVANPENHELLDADGRGSAHAQGAHGNRYSTQRSGLAADPGFDENVGMTVDPRRPRVLDSVSGKPAPGPGMPEDANMLLEDEGRLTARPKDQSMSEFLDEQATHHSRSAEAAVDSALDAGPAEWAEALGLSPSELFELCERLGLSPARDLYKLRRFLQ